MPEGLVGLRNSGNSRSGSWYLTTWDSYKPNQFINHSSIIKITAVAAAATIQWVTALCQALHQELRVHDLSKECCLLPHSSQVALSHLEKHFPGLGCPWYSHKLTGTWITSGMVRTVRNRRELPYDWFAAGPESHEASENSRVTSCNLGPMESLPNSCFLPSFSLLPPTWHMVKEKKGKTDAYSWSVQFNGQKPDMSHVIKSS